MDIGKNRGQGMNITAVVVLYNIRPDQSPTIATLVRSYQRIRGSGTGLSLIIYDNSPKPQPVNIPLPFEYRYAHDASNGGLAAAYNFALQADPANTNQWLLLLDQDSTLPENFLEEAFKALSLIGPDDGVAAAVPRILQHGRPISPALVKGGRVSPVKNPGTGVSRKNLTAINSGALLRKSFLSGIGGFNQKFRLDYLDHWLFSEIRRRGKRVYVTGAAAGHELSVGDMDRQMTSERYLSVLRSETLFYRNYAGGWNFLCHLCNLPIRSFRHLLYGRRDFSLMTLGHFFRTLANRQP